MNDESVALMREAVELEAATEKHPVTPGSIVPAHELTGGDAARFGSTGRGFRRI